MALGERREEAWHAFLALWEQVLDRTNRPDTVVVVEGERDSVSLRGLGIRARIVLVHRGDRIGALAQSLAGRRNRVVVLTDWDSEGGQLARKLKEFLEADSREFDLDIRRRLARALRGEITHVEGLFGWARRMAERSGTPLEELLARMAA